MGSSPSSRRSETGATASPESRTPSSWFSRLVGIESFSVFHFIGLAGGSHLELNSPHTQAGRVSADHCVPGARGGSERHASGLGGGRRYLKVHLLHGVGG